MPLPLPASGILSTLGNACFGCYFRFTSYTRSIGNYSWAYILLHDCTASPCWWKKYSEDSSMGVSFLLLLFFLFQLDMPFLFPGFDPLDNIYDAIEVRYSYTNIVALIITVVVVVVVIIIILVLSCLFSHCSNFQHLVVQIFYWGLLLLLSSQPSMRDIFCWILQFGQMTDRCPLNYLTRALHFLIMYGPL